MTSPHYDFSRTEIRPFVPEAAQSLLDVGCGGGAFVRGLRELRPDLRVWGVEPDAVSADSARAGGFEQVVCAPFGPGAAAGLSRSTFDVVCFNDVLEHMTSPETALSTAAALLEPGGLLVASIPNVRHFSVVWDLVRRGDWRYTEYGILDKTHVRFFTRKTMTEMFEAGGWQIQTITGINRCRWPEAGADTWKTRWLSRATRGRSDPFFFVQYVICASR